jgi:hypothetical protein
MGDNMKRLIKTVRTLRRLLRLARRASPTRARSKKAAHEKIMEKINAHSINWLVGAHFSRLLRARKVIAARAHSFFQFIFIQLHHPAARQHTALSYAALLAASLGNNCHLFCR